MPDETTPPVQPPAVPPATPPAGTPPVGQQVTGQTISLEEHTRRVAGLNKKLTEALGQAGSFQDQLTALQVANEQLVSQATTLQTTVSERDTALSTAQQAAQAAEKRAHLLSLAASSNPKLLPLLAAGSILPPGEGDDEAILASFKELEGQIQSAFGSAAPVPPAPNLPQAPVAPGTQPAGSPPLPTSGAVDVTALRTEHRALSGDFQTDPAAVQKRMMEIEALLHQHNAAGAI